ncbi:MAG: protein-disulfide isomerase [Gammaproteobacteria bacterium]|nr:protein-disulfide isomerase [Gammaproteobacteria bacterium]
MKLYRSANTLLIVLSFFVASSCFSQDEIGSLKDIRAKFLKDFPDMPILEIVETEIPDFYEISLDHGNRLYVRASGDFLFVGDLFKIQEDQIVNLTEKSKKRTRRNLLLTSDQDEMIIFSAKAEKAFSTITVFTDIDCSYCRKLHNEINTLNEQGISVRYLAFPRAGIGSESYNKAVSAWCSANPAEALTRAKSGEKIEEKYCLNPVKKHLELGRKLGISGTPAIIFEDGTLQPGYLPAAEMSKALGIM